MKPREVKAQRNDQNFLLHKRDSAVTAAPHPAAVEGGPAIRCEPKNNCACGRALSALSRHEKGNDAPLQLLHFDFYQHTGVVFAHDRVPRQAQIRQGGPRLRLAGKLMDGT